MPKTNFTKAEEAWSEAMQKTTKARLLEQTDSKKAAASKEELKNRNLLTAALLRELKRLHRKDKEIYKKLSIKRKEFENLVVNVNTLTPEEWAIIVQAKEKVDAHLKILAQNPANDEKIVEEQRLKHINKRFNVSDKWLPLQ
jgi:hypothetical protein